MARKKSVLLVDTDPQGSCCTWSDVAVEREHTTLTVVAMGVGLHCPGLLTALAERHDTVVVDCPPRHDELQRAVLTVTDAVRPQASTRLLRARCLRTSQSVHERLKTSSMERNTVES